MSPKWLFSSFPLQLPVNLLRAGRIFTFEPPPGVKSNLIRTFNTIPASRMMRSPNERARLYFLLAWFHAIVQVNIQLQQGVSYLIAILWRWSKCLYWGLTCQISNKIIFIFRNVYDIVPWDGPNPMSSMRAIWKLPVTCWTLGLTQLLGEGPIYPLKESPGKQFWRFYLNVSMVEKLTMILIKDFCIRSWRNYSMPSALR